jgi:hypothetical protein
VSSFHHNKLYWRITFLLLCGIALVGPWWFDSTARLGGDCLPGFPLDRDWCASPRAGLWLVLGAFGSFFALFQADSGLLTASMDFVTLLRGLLGGLLFLLPLLPFPVTFVIMMLQEDDGRHGQLVQVVIWGVAAIGAGLLGQQLATLGPRWALWGLWLYISLALAMLLLESSALWRSRQTVYYIDD